MNEMFSISSMPQAASLDSHYLSSIPVLRMPSYLASDEVVGQRDCARHFSVYLSAASTIDIANDLTEC